MSENRIRVPKLLVSALAFMGLSCIALATGAEAQIVAPPRQGCTAAPNAQKPADQNLAGKLDDCNSVLTPPKVGDGGIVTPPPQTGKMPVIKPGDLPANQSK